MTPILYDPAKDEINRRKHGVSLARAADLEIAIAVEDARRDYGESRFAPMACWMVRCTALHSPFAMVR
ncbi:MAG: hypothetical protein ACXWVH_02080 [Caulobacteraceae bacterium]